MKTLFGLLLLIGAVCASDYCAIQGERCVATNLTKHIGCDTNNWPVNDNFKFIDFPAIKKEYIVFQLNFQKNKCASGRTERITTGATKLQTIKYNEELEFLANKSITHLPTDNSVNSFACALIDGSQRINTLAYKNYDYTHINDESFLERAYVQILRSFESNYMDKSEFANTFAFIDQIGCAYGAYNEASGAFVRTVRCLATTGPKELTAYDEGFSATKCRDLNLAESSIFPALCA